MYNFFDSYIYYALAMRAYLSANRLRSARSAAMKNSSISVSDGTISTVDLVVDSLIRMFEIVVSFLRKLECECT